MIRVLVINTVKFQTNGISNVIIDFYQNMDRTGIAFDFVANEDIERKYGSIIKKNGDRFVLFHNRNRKPLSYIKGLSSLIKRNKYDIIHIHGNSALMSIELRAIQKSGSDAKVLVHVHNTNCTHQMLNKALNSYFVKHYDYALACSKAAGEWLYKDRPFTVINNGVDEQRFRYQPELRKSLRAESGIEGKFVVTHVGRFNEQKNHVFLIKIFEALHRMEPDSVLRLVGTGALEQKIREIVQNSEAGEYISFVGVTDTVEKEYNMADVFVLPSLYESFGLVNVEAQCTGLPCVISDTVPKDIKITEQVRFLSLQDPPEKWAKAILSFKGAPRKSNEEQVVSHHYSIHSEAKVLADMYRKIAEKNL